ncbi:hypothetical protein PCE1_002808 [Barthelona sp. PCE]
MLLVYNDFGTAAIQRRSIDGGRMMIERVPLTPPDKTYTGVYWVSKDESTVAIACKTRLYVINIASLKILMNIIVQKEVTTGCLSYDGSIVTFCEEGTQYHTLTVAQKFTTLSSFSFSDGQQCFVNSECVYISTKNEMYVIEHQNSQNQAKKFNGVPIQTNEAMYTIHRASNGYFLIDTNSNNALVRLDSPIENIGFKIADISAKYILCANDLHFVLIHRATGQQEWDAPLPGTIVKNAHISYNNKHITVVYESDQVELYDIEQKTCVAMLPVYLAGYNSSYITLGQNFVRVSNKQFLSVLYYNTVFVTTDWKAIPHKVSNGFLVFEKQHVSYVSENRCVHRKKYENSNCTVSTVHYNGLSEYCVTFTDGKVLYIEWNENDGFGRECECSGSVFDTQAELSSLRTKLDEQQQKTKELNERYTELQNELRNTQKIQKLELDSKLQVVFDAMNQLIPNSGHIQFNDLLSSSDECLSALWQTKPPTHTFLKWIKSNPLIQTMERHLEELEMAIKFVNEVDNIMKTFKITEHLSSYFSSRYNEIVAQYPVAGVLNKNSYATQLTKLKNVDSHFKVFFEIKDYECIKLHTLMTYLINKHKLLLENENKLCGIRKSLENFRSTNEDIQTNTIDFDLVYTLKNQTDQHISDILSQKNAYLQNACHYLVKIANRHSEELKLIIDEFTLEVDLTDTMRQLGLESIAMPFVPKIISFDAYMNGKLEELGLNNGYLETDSLFIKCICVSDKFRGEVDNNKQALQRELRILTKRIPCAVTLRNVVLVPETKRGSTTVKFVCLELEYAKHNLEQYMTAFPDLSIETRDSLAHQLVNAVFTMHANGFMLLDIKPQNVLVSYNNDDGSDVQLQLCDFGVNISNAALNSTAIVGAEYLAFEVFNGQPHTFLSDIYLLGKNISYIYNILDDESKECAHSEIIQRCLAQEPQLRPSIHELSCHEWINAPVPQDRIARVRRQINQFVVAKQKLLGDGTPMEFIQMETSFDKFFVKVFSDVDTFMNGAEHFSSVIKMHDTNLTLPQFVDHIFEHRVLPHLDADSSDNLIEAMCGFLYCCFVFQAPIDDMQIGQFLLNALSADFNKLSDENIFNRVFPANSAHLLNMLDKKDLNFNVFGGDDRLVTSKNTTEFLQLARSTVSNQWIELSKKVNTSFYAYELTAQLGAVLSVDELRHLMCTPPYFTVENVLTSLNFTDVITSEVRDTFSDVLHHFNSEDLLRFVYWLNGSPKLYQFTVVLQKYDTTLPSVAFCDRTLKLPNNAMHVREGLPLAIQGILQNGFNAL